MNTITTDTTDKTFTVATTQEAVIKGLEPFDGYIEQEFKAELLKALTGHDIAYIVKDGRCSVNLNGVNFFDTFNTDGNTVTEDNAWKKALEVIRAYIGDWELYESCLWEGEDYLQVEFGYDEEGEKSARKELAVSHGMIRKAFDGRINDARIIADTLLM